ncbi:hypothetical protein [Rhizobium straminoryzae]|uniref:Uncharacterized protein n=1 Tax=Rhizobium straminoryzae TaxID=1387186 RepID=A0A549T0T7_9HYPH|nr:hypothetical protein [Rhizobium straminoryzae]TRL35485.1 hypothetical protein FNA46_19990 [Rhizobium straminoryzae]
MNRTLISFLDSANQLLAIIITLGGAIAGGMSGHETAGVIIFAIVGGILGLIAASIVCGVLATLIEIERHLRAMRESTNP